MRSERNVWEMEHDEARQGGHQDHIDGFMFGNSCILLMTVYMIDTDLS
jgi:hypothetical protein